MDILGAFLSLVFGENVLADLVKQKRLKQEMSEHPSMLIIDAQSVRTCNKGEQRGFDGEKKVKRRKRQIVVDTQGNLHQVLVHKANIHDSKGGGTVLADLGYRGFFEDVVTILHQRSVEFSSKITGQFIIQPKRWIVERTIAWLNWARRLSKDFEQKCIYSENIIRISAIALILK